MKTLITNITVNENTVFTTYNRNGNSYEGFNPYSTREEAIKVAKEQRELTVFDGEFYCNSKTTLTIN